MVVEVTLQPDTNIGSGATTNNNSSRNGRRGSSILFGGGGRRRGRDRGTRKGNNGVTTITPVIQIAADDDDDYNDYDYNNDYNTEYTYNLSHLDHHQLRGEGKASCWYPGKYRIDDPKMMTTTSSRSSRSSGTTIATGNNNKSKSFRSRMMMGGGGNNISTRSTRTATTRTAATRRSMTSGSGRSGGRHATTSSTSTFTSGSSTSASLSTKSLSNGTSGILEDDDGGVNAIERAFLQGGGGRGDNDNSRLISSRQRSPNSIILQPIDDGHDDEDSMMMMMNNSNSKSHGDSGGIVVVKSLAGIETNCMHKEFWTDEIVEGGAFACFSEGTPLARRTRCTNVDKEDEDEEKVVVVVDNDDDDDATSALNSIAVADTTTSVRNKNVNYSHSHDNDDDGNRSLLLDDDDDDDRLTTIEDTPLAPPTTNVLPLNDVVQNAMMCAATTEDNTGACAPMSSSLSSSRRRLPQDLSTMDDDSSSRNGGVRGIEVTTLGVNDSIPDHVLDAIYQQNQNQNKKQQQRRFGGVGGSSRVGFGKVQYISEEPLELDIGDDVVGGKVALRRAMCHKIRLKKQQNTKKNQKKKSNQPSPIVGSSTAKTRSKKSSSTSAVATAADVPGASLGAMPPSGMYDYEACMLPNPQEQSMSVGSNDTSNGGNTAATFPTFSPPWKDCPSMDIADPSMMMMIKKKQYRQPPTMTADEDEAVNFYVEVEAMKEQLNGIRDLEEIQEEEGGTELEGEINIARTASLVDDDSTFMKSVNNAGGRFRKNNNSNNQKNRRNRMTKGNQNQNTTATATTTTTQKKKPGFRLARCGNVRDSSDRSYPVSYSQNGTKRFQPQRSTSSNGKSGTVGLASYDYLKSTPTRSNDDNNDGDEVKYDNDKNTFVEPIPLTRTMSEQIARRALELSGLQQESSERGLPVNTSASNLNISTETEESYLHEIRPMEVTNGDVSSLRLNTTTDTDTSSSRNVIDESFQSGYHSRIPSVSNHHMDVMSTDAPSPPRNRDMSMTSTTSMSRDGRNISSSSAQEVSRSREMLNMTGNSSQWQESDVGYFGSHEDSQMRDTSSSIYRLHQEADQSWSADSNGMGDLAIPQSPILDYSFDAGGQKERGERSVAHIPSEVLSSPGGQKFDDNFWQADDASGLDTNAFEEFDNEQDSVFGDLKSVSNVSTPEISSKSSGGSDRSPGSLRGYLQPNVLYADNRQINPKQHISKRRDHIAEYSTERSRAGSSRFTDPVLEYNTTAVHSSRMERSNALSNHSRLSVSSPFSYREDNDDFETHKS